MFNPRHCLLLITTTVALSACAYQPKEAHYLPTHPDFEVAPTVLKKGTIFMRPTNPPTPQQQAQAEANAEAYNRKLTRGVKSLDPTEWVDIKDVRIVLHTDNRRLDDLVSDVINQATPYAGPWRVQWKLSKPNLDLLDEPFSLNTETTFGELVSYIADFMVNYRGVRLKFEMFNAERILVITDNG